jgi:hypothetical protein
MCGVFAEGGPGEFGYERAADGKTFATHRHRWRWTKTRIDASVRRGGLPITLGVAQRKISRLPSRRDLRRGARPRAALWTAGLGQNGQQIIASELGVVIKTSSGPLLERKGDLTTLTCSITRVFFLTKLSPGSCDRGFSTAMKIPDRSAIGQAPARGFIVYSRSFR